MRHRLRRRTIQGYMDFGDLQIPPLPQNICMQGRDNGVFYHLTHTGTAGSLVLSLSTTLPTQPDTVFYGPHAGPYLAGDIRLYITGGSLIYETVSPDLVFNQRVLTRRGTETTMLEILAPATAGGPLQTQEVEV